MSADKGETLEEAIMVPEQFAAAMSRISLSDDPENNHIHADALMCKLLKDLGYGNGIDIFRSMNKWYA